MQSAFSCCCSPSDEPISAEGQLASHGWAVELLCSQVLREFAQGHPRPSITAMEDAPP